ncbi:MAG: helix-turn-helix transcriptional regulator [Chloroflexota bacterium]
MWDASGVRSLRLHMGVTQQELAQELGTRQQTISEWETGLYQPRGLSQRLLSIIAERADFQYEAREGGIPGSGKDAPKG